MSLVPVFEIGIWNAWIFMTYLLLSFPFFFRIAIKHGAPAPGESTLSRCRSILATSSKLLLLPAMVYSIFLPLELGTMWFYIGLPVTLIGLGAYTKVLINWAMSPPGESVGRGLYRYSRNPMYVAMYIFLPGLAIATASWLFLLLFIVFVAGCYVYISVEEKGLIESYGDSYREYMKSTPRWLGLPKSGVVG